MDSGAAHIPVIDLSPLSACDASVRWVAGEILNATEQVGFFYIRNHGIDAALIERAVAASQRFFAHPLEAKREVGVNQLNRGFMGLGECTLDGASHHCLKEVFFWGAEQDGNSGVERPLVGPNRWPPFMPTLRTELWPYYEAVMSCGHRLLSAMAVAMDLAPDFFVSRYRHPLGRGQLLHYPPHPADAFEDQFGAAEHTDFGCITLLWQDSSGGLEVRSRTGEWVCATPIEGTLVVNIGDLLSRWSNDRMRSTRHRVRNLADQPRFSMAVFFDPDSEAVVDPRDMLSDCAEQPLHTPVTAGDYIMSRNRGAFAHYG